MATEDLTRALDEVGAAYELLTHAHTESAFAEAQALGLEPDDVAKALIVKTLEGYLCAVVPASGRLAEPKPRDLTGGSKKDVHPRHRGRPSARLPRLRARGCTAGRGRSA